MFEEIVYLLSVVMMDTITYTFSLYRLFYTKPASLLVLASATVQAYIASLE